MAHDGRQALPGGGSSRESSDRVLVVFTRYPEPGRAKKRLIPLLGAAGAASLQREMALRAMKTARRMMPRVDLELHCDGADDDAVSALFGQGFGIRHQGEGGLGARMLESFRHASQEGYLRMVLMGTDCPLVTEEVIGGAFEALEDHDLVLGPAEDGGYYLIGLNGPCREIFEDIPWGSGRVLSETLARAKALRMSVAFTARLPDVDRPGDIPVWEEAYERESPVISVIIPALNEGGGIARAIEGLGRAPGIEVIVVDGGSSDGTIALAEGAGARVVRSGPGRAVQMNAGARQAKGEILLFLHGDTLLPPGFDRSAREALKDFRTAAGAFSLAFDKGGMALGLIARGANLRSRFLQLPYGDQGIFVRRGDFLAKGGYPELPIMEDVALVRALRHDGRIVTVPPKAVTSGRRYAALGAAQAWIINQCVVLCSLLGADHGELSRRYRSGSGLRAWLPFMCGAFAKRAGRVFRSGPASP